VKACGVDVWRLTRLYVLALGALLLLEGGALIVVDRLALPVGSLASDTRHNLLHVVWGIALLVLAWIDQAAIGATVFGIFYVALAFAGVLLTNPFGLQLGLGENAFHFIVGPLTLVLGVVALRSSSSSRAARIRKTSSSVDISR
jgi:hypothetical protein